MMELVHELRRVMDAEIEQFSLSTGTGAACDWADYRFRVGIVVGWVRARAKLDEWVSQVNADEADEIEHVAENPLLPSDWAKSTPENDPVPVEEYADLLPVPTGYRMLVKPYEVQQKSAGGILLVPESKEYADMACSMGQVIRQGPDCYQDEKFSEPWCKVGDFVLYARHVGQKVEIKLADQVIKFLLINDSDVRALVPNPERIKTYL